MAKEVAVGKRAKISEAQQYMILAVLGASIVLGVAISFITHFVKQISFNTEVIMAEEQSIKAYSDVIKTTGVCKAPSGDVYSNQELEACDPNGIEVAEIPNTLRSNILEKLAANTALNSVPKDDNSSCKNPQTDKPFTYDELIKEYRNANGADELVEASQLIKNCSALRIIPDALPASKNEEALLASLNKLFNLSGWEPETISPGGTATESALQENLNMFTVSLSVEGNTNVTMKVLDNIERSIREFNIGRATIEWESDSTLKLQATADAYYINRSSISEETQTISMENEN